MFLNPWTKEKIKSKEKPWHSTRKLLDNETGSTTAYLPRKLSIDFSEFSILNTEEFGKFPQGQNYLSMLQQASNIQAE